MTSLNWVLSFVLGILPPLLLGTGARLVLGLRLNLFLTNRESMLQDQQIIPITSELKKTSILRSLRKGHWKEDVELTLRDYRDQSYRIQIGYHLWRRFTLTYVEGPDSLFIDGKKVDKTRTYPLRSGQTLRLDDRAYGIWVTPRQEDALNREKPIASRAA